MNDIEGTVSEVREVEFKPGHVLHSFQIEGNEDWFSLGKVSPVTLGVEVGNRVTYSERNRRVLPKSVFVVGHGSADPVVEAQPAKDVAVASKPASSSDIANRIQWQSARRDATSVVVAALHTDSLPWASNVAKSKRLDLLQGYITELTEQLLTEEAKHG